MIFVIYIEGGGGEVEMLRDTLQVVPWSPIC